MQRNFLLLIIVSFFSLNVKAQLKIAGGLGIGSSSTANEVAESEGPLTQLYTIETLAHSRLAYGAEHLRSLAMAGLSTSISFTGFFANYYFNGAPVPYLKPDQINGSAIVFHDICYFAGMGVGMGQSNRLPDINNKSSNAAAVYLSPRAGADLQLTKSLGFRSELMIAMGVFGKGSLSSFSLVGQIYWSF